MASARTEDKKVVAVKENFTRWLEELYDVSKISAEEVRQIYESVRYVGFDRNEVLNELMAKGIPRNVLIEIIIACAVRGPTKASEAKLSNGRTIKEMGIVSSGLKSKKGISCQRITASTADLAAYYLKLINFPKRLSGQKCPGWLQFPSAGSIKLPVDLRAAHKEFSEVFSKQIKGEFNEQIYEQMTQNAYLDPRLRLFD